MTNINFEIDIGKADMQDTYIHLARRFVAVSDAGSIKRASQDLNLSQPALTQSVQNIEDIFGCRLFERSQKGIVLTAMGERLYVRSRRMLDELALAREEISDLATGRIGALRISAGMAWGYCYLPDIIRRLQEQFPELEVDLDIAVSAKALAALREGRADVVFGSDNATFQEEGFVRSTLVTVDFAVACGLPSPLSKRESVKLDDVFESPVVIYQDDTELIDRVLTRIEQKAGRSLNIAVKTKSLLATLELVRSGRYVAFIARPFLERFSGPDIKVLPLDEPLYQFPTAIYYRKTLTHAAPFRTLLGFLDEFRATNGPR
ncbi:MAG: hypothetical protein CMH13_04465 [Martelella sp.]|nr:hypothetical protein [Martelella sp.]|tara:strand:+ start:1711 stop:2667 length:957 start_codon:yes stop_codon:yes gene_type:complete